MDFNLKAVLFDMDGVVFNTEQLYEEAWRNTFSAFKIPFDSSFYLGLTGIPSSHCMRYLHNRYGDTLDCKAFLELKQKTFMHLRREKLSYRSGFVFLIEEVIRRGLKIGLVTSARRDDVNCNFKVLPQYHSFFDVVVTSDDVIEPKPDPECYLLAATLLGVAANVCLAIEDSQVGVVAAHSAGCHTVWIPEVCTTMPLSMQPPIITVLCLRDIVPMLRNGMLPMRA